MANPNRSQAVASDRNGDALLSTRQATVADSAAPAALSQLAAPAGGTGATEGAYDTAANRDLAIASINAARDDIIALRAEVATLTTQVVAMNAVLEAHGLSADA